MTGMFLLPETRRMVDGKGTGIRALLGNAAL